MTDHTTDASATPSYTSEAVVTEALTASNMGSGDMPVLATPALVALMENAAMLCVGPLLPSGHTTVGGSIDVRHLAPSPVGVVVKATATLTEQDGRRYTFAVKAHEGDKLIATATHVRFDVDREKFLARLT